MDKSFKEYQEDCVKTMEELRAAVFCPHPREAREMLGLNVWQFCKLLQVSDQTYWAWVSGEREPSVHQKAFISEAIRIAREKGFIRPPVNALR